MKWILLAELAVTVLLFVFGAIAYSSGGSADERLGSVPLFLGGGAMIVVTIVTLFGWVFWQMTFRG